MVVNSEHKTILTSLMNRFCEQSVMTPREVTTSLVSKSPESLTNSHCLSHIFLCI
jgi:hypothetical protein